MLITIFTDYQYLFDNSGYLKIKYKGMCRWWRPSQHIQVIMLHYMFVLGSNDQALLDFQT